MEPTLDEALDSLLRNSAGDNRGYAFGGSGERSAPAPLSKAMRDQAIAKLAEAQKAINALKQLLANPAQ